MLLVKCMDEDVVNGLDEETFQCQFNVCASIEFKKLDTMELFDGGDLRACGSNREDW